MLRSILLFTILSTALVAADFSGRWAGTIETGQSRAPIYMIFSMRDGNVSGSVATGRNTAAVPIESAEVRNGELSFQVHDNANRVMQFRLTFTDGVFGGEASAGAQTARVAVVQVFGGMGGSVAPQTANAGGPGAGVYRVGGGVSAPMLIRKVEPDYSPEARAAKYQGTVLLYVEIAPDGRATNIRVQRGLGLGLDEKAIEAVKQWVFKPGEKDGKPVTVEANIEVNFRL